MAAGIGMGKGIRFKANLEALTLTPLMPQFPSAAKIVA
jgi:hypothetical protein